MADKGGLQLLPETRKKIEIKVPGENRLIYVASAILAAVVLVYAGTVVYANNIKGQLDLINTNLTNLEKQRNKQNEDKLLLFSKQTQQVTSILSHHVLWSQAISRFKSLLSSQVQLVSFEGGTDKNTIIFSANAASYTSIARQINILLNDDGIKNATLESLDMQNNVIKFSMLIEFDPAMFIYTIVPTNE